MKKQFCSAYLILNLMKYIEHSTVFNAEKFRNMAGAVIFAISLSTGEKREDKIRMEVDISSIRRKEEEVQKIKN